MTKTQMTRWGGFMALVVAAVTVIGAASRVSVAAVRQYDQVDVDSVRIDHVEQRVDSLDGLVNSKLDELLRRVPSR